MIGAQVGNFKIVSQLGRGGMGEVYLGDHEKIGTKVAIKVLQPQISDHQDHVERFFNEARAVGSIQHSGIGKIFDVGFHDSGRAYLVMEFLAGETLAARIRKLGRMPLGAVCEVGRQICGVLEAVHKAGITHRDLKPDNIFIVPDEELGERVKIVDFGIAKLSNMGPGLTATGSGSMGTPAYMSPEQWKNSKAVDWRADAYSLGCLTFEMVAGRPPFIAQTIGEACSQHLTEEPPRLSSIVPVPPALETLIARLLAKAPEQRPESMREIADAFGQVAAHAPALGVTQLSRPRVALEATLPSTPPTPPAPAPVPTAAPVATPASKRGLIMALVGISAALAIVVVVLLARGDRGQPDAGLAIDKPIGSGSATAMGSGSATATGSGSAASGSGATTASGSGSAAAGSGSAASGSGTTTATGSGSAASGSATASTASSGSGSAVAVAAGSAKPPARQVPPGRARIGDSDGRIGGESGSEPAGKLGSLGIPSELPKHTPASREVTRRLHPRLFACGQRHDAVGTNIMWTIDIKPDGSVLKVTFADNLSGPLQSCLTSVFKSARFKPSQLGTRALDSITLR